MKSRNRNILAVIPGALLPGVMLVANSAYRDWRFYQRFSSLQDKSFEYTSPTMGGGFESPPFPASVTVAAVLIVAWVLLTSYLVVQVMRVSRRDKLASKSGAGD